MAKRDEGALFFRHADVLKFINIIIFNTTILYILCLIQYYIINDYFVSIFILMSPVCIYYSLSNSYM